MLYTWNSHIIGTIERACSISGWAAVPASGARSFRSFQSTKRERALRALHAYNAVWWRRKLKLDRIKNVKMSKHKKNQQDVTRMDHNRLCHMDPYGTSQNHHPPGCFVSGVRFLSIQSQPWRDAPVLFYVLRCSSLIQSGSVGKSLRENRANSWATTTLWVSARAHPGPWQPTLQVQLMFHPMDPKSSQSQVDETQIF